MSSKAKYLIFALDGPGYSGRSSLLRRLTHGKFGVTDKGSRLPLFDFKSFKLNGIEFLAEIWDLKGSDEYMRLVKINPGWASADIIIACFDISDPKGLEHLITFSIPCFRKLSKPILLVGLKSDLRQDSSEARHSLFPYEFGPCLAHLVGAVKYMECSAKTNQGIQEVFEEAIRAISYEKSHYFMILNDNLKGFLLSKLPTTEEWKSIIEKVDPLQMPSTIDPKLRDDLECLEQHFCNSLSNGTSNLMSYGDFIARRTLAIDTFCLANCDLDIDFLRAKYSKRVMILCSSDQVHMATGTVSKLIECASLTKTSISLKFANEYCSSITAFFDSRSSCRTIHVKSLVIISCVDTLNLNFLSTLEGLQNLVIIDTTVDLSHLSFSTSVISTLKCLILKKCQTDTSNIPAVIGMLSQLERLDVTCSGFKILPKSLGHLDNLHTLRCNHDQIVFPPKSVLQKPAQEIVQYLKAFDDKTTSTAYREAKIMVLGQERVGKSTLVKSLKRTLRILKTDPPPKTDGVDISVLQLPNYNCKVYDLAGDVEYLNTHALFFSPYCLHLAVFNLSHFIVSKGIRSSDLFSRLELWLQTIACRDPNSRAIIVGTQLDRLMLSPEVLTRIRKNLEQLLERYRPCHLATSDKVDECLMCNKLCDDPLEGSLDKRREDFEGDKNRSGVKEVPSADNQIPSDEAIYQSSIPHILGTFEVSGVTNTNVKSLKRQLQNSIEKIKQYTNTETIPSKWLAFRHSVKTALSQNKKLEEQPIYKLSEVDEVACKSEICNRNAITAMLRFFHAQGVFLWYEDIPEMKDVVILDPQWLANQLRTLISHLPHVNAVCEGILHHSKLPEIWGHTSEENRFRLITLFRKVGLCFSVSEMEDLFPCKLPVGWPDREMWSSQPKPDESQTSLLFSFSFLPPSFFPDVIVAINEKRAYFPSTVQPLYYRFNVVYITKDENRCPRHSDECLMHIVRRRFYETKILHRIHFEVMPYKNTMKVTIRGPRPCCMIPDIESTIEVVKLRRYPGLTYDERVVCPECEMKKLHSPSTLAFDDSHEGLCHKGHKVGSIDDILAGKMSSSDLIPSAVAQVGRTMGEVLEDHFCPKLFAVLPINISSLSFIDRFVYSYLRDGYAVHLLCESPDEWHFVSSPGFRVGKPKEFFKIHGGRVCKLLRVISALGAPFQIASAIDPHCKVGAAAAARADKMRKEIKGLLDDYLEKYPHLKSSLGSPNDDLKDLKSSDGLSRTELSRFLEVVAKGRDFGPLTCTYVDKFNEWFWLCEEHNQKYKIVER